MCNVQYLRSISSGIIVDERVRRKTYYYYCRRRHSRGIFYCCKIYIIIIVRQNNNAVVSSTGVLFDFNMCVAAFVQSFHVYKIIYYNAVRCLLYIYVRLLYENRTENRLIGCATTRSAVLYVYSVFQQSRIVQQYFQNQFLLLKYLTLMHKSLNIQSKYEVLFRDNLFYNDNNRYLRRLCVKKKI